MSVTPRKLGQDLVYPVGLGCMNFSHGYGPPLDEADAIHLLHEAIDLGYNFLDTATLYGFGNNERIIGKALAEKRHTFLLASKCVLMFEGEKRYIDGRPETITAACDASLKRLGMDVIDLYYMHRPDPNVPIEDSIGAMADLVAAGKIRMIGLSEMGAGLLRRAAAVHPIAAMQSEYSLITRNPEIAVIEACRELGTAFVPFSPVGRGLLANSPPTPDSYHKRDMRSYFPRYVEPNYSANLALLETAREIAADLNCTIAQLAIAWTMAQGDDMLPIPGTTNLQHLKDNFHAAEIVLEPYILARLNETFTPEAVSGARYAPAMQKSVDTERFPFEMTE
ncbi:MAG: aldo/keto reductase [Hyphomonas sp.]